jgi:hypothetical protein
MNTTTVIEIIKMIDAQLFKLEEHYNQGMNDTEYYSVSGSLGKLRDHLQSFIEGQVSAIENSTGE